MSTETKIDTGPLEKLREALARGVSIGLEQHPASIVAEIINILGHCRGPGDYGMLGPWTAAALLGYRSRDAEVAERYRVYAALEVIAMQQSQQITALQAEKAELVEALTHMSYCQSCAEGSWNFCNEGQKASALLAKHGKEGQ